MSSAKPRFEKTLQIIVPCNELERFEGVAFAARGNILAVATADANKVLLYRRTEAGFETSPYCTLEDGARCNLKYPHDVSFSNDASGGLLAVAQRQGAISIFAKNPATEMYGPSPVCEIFGSQARLGHSDGVAFVPPADDHLAVCNLLLSTISFYRRSSRSAAVFASVPEFELKHPDMFHPDGLCLSSCGQWLAVANHGANSVSIFMRRNKLLTGGKLRYGPNPITTIRDPQFRYPHSVAFASNDKALWVTNAGANFLSAYARPRWFHKQWSFDPIVRKALVDQESFARVNFQNKMEGGPKGLAIDGKLLAVCSPEVGVKIYSD